MSSLTGAVHLLCIVSAVPYLVDGHYCGGSYLCCPLEQGRLQSSDSTHLHVPVTWYAAPIHIFTPQPRDEACVCEAHKQREFWDCR